MAADEIRARGQFVLLDEQTVAFDTIRQEVDKARGGDHKSVVIVSGGPAAQERHRPIRLFAGPRRNREVRRMQTALLES